MVYRRPIFIRELIVTVDTAARCCQFITSYASNYRLHYHNNVIKLGAYGVQLFVKGMHLTDTIATVHDISRA